MSEIEGALRRLGRRLLMAISPARVTGVVDGGNVQMLQVQINNDEVRDNTPRLAEFGFTSSPPAGTDAVVIFVGGDRSNGVCVATGNQTLRMKGLAAGEVALYDAQDKRVYLSQGGIVIEARGQSVTINDASEVIVNGPTTINGNVTVNGSITATGDVVGGGHSLDNHVHGGVNSGSSDTSGPIG